MTRTWAVPTSLFLGVMGTKLVECLIKVYQELKIPDLWVRVRWDSQFLITLDLGFSDVRRYAPGTHPGILLLRPRRKGRNAVSNVLRRVLMERRLEMPAGCLAVRTRVRLPKTGGGLDKFMLRRTTDEVRVCDQFENRKADRPDDSAECAGEGGQSDSVIFKIGLLGGTLCLERCRLPIDATLLLPANLPKSYALC